MPESFDEIPIDELLIYDGDELIFDGSDPSTYVVIEPGTSTEDMFAALGWTEQDEHADSDDDQGAGAS
jgi:hypothetical protein